MAKKTGKKRGRPRKSDAEKAKKKATKTAKKVDKSKDSAPKLDDDIKEVLEDKTEPIADEIKESPESDEGQAKAQAEPKPEAQPKQEEKQQPDEPFEPLRDEPKGSKYNTGYDEGAEIEEEEIPEPQAYSPPPSQAEPQEAEPLNPAAETMTPKEKRDAAAMTVDIVLAAYEKLHGLGRWYVKLPKEELDKMAAEGKLNVDMSVPLGDGQEITVREFVEMCNKNADDAIRVNEDFIEEVRPVMIRVFIKHGWILSDEQYLLIKFGEDLASKIAVVYALKKTVNAAIEAMSKYYQSGQERTDTSHSGMNDEGLHEPEEAEIVND